jgi:hypothetical protein
MRGKRSTKADALSDRDRRDLQRILRKVGLEKYIQLGKEEIARPSPDDFDNAILPGLVLMEEQSWKYQRSREAKRIFRQRTREQGRQDKLLTREEIIRATINALRKDPPESDLDQIEDPTVRAAWKNRKRSLGSGTETSIVKRLVRKLRDRTRLREMIDQIAKLEEIRVERGATHHEEATAVRKLAQLRQKLRESRYKVRN